MVDQNKKPDVKGQLGQIERAKRNLIDRKKEVDDQIAKLTSEMSGMEERAPLSMLQNAIKDEIANQQKIRQEIERHAQDIRKLRQEKTKLSQERNEVVEEIRSRQLRVAEYKRDLRGPDVSDEQKATLKGKIEELEGTEIPTYRSMVAEKSSQIAKVNTDIQGKLGEREFSESSLSVSRREVQAMKPEATAREAIEAQREKLEKKSPALEAGIAEYEERRKKKQLADAERMTPTSLRKELTAEDPLDPAREGRRAGAAIAAQGASTLGQKQYAKATEEFTALFNAIKETKRSLAELDETSEEYAKKQEELIDLQGKAADNAKKMREIEQRTENAPKVGSWGRGVQAVGQAVSGAFSNLGDRAADRFALDEERKNAELRTKTSYSRFMMERGDSAEALLMTGGGGKIGMEDPFTKSGEINQNIKALGKDFANAKQAAPTYALMADVISDLPGAMAKITERTAEGAAQGSSTGVGMAPGAAAGTFRGVVEAGREIGTKLTKGVLASPEAAATMQLDKIASFTRDAIGVPFELLKSSAEVAGKGLKKGGADAEKFSEGVNQAADAGKELVTSFNTLIKRSTETVGIFNKLNTATMTKAQLDRIQERYSMAATPLLQSYMNTMAITKQTLRSRYTTRDERVEESQNIDKFSGDQELTDRGFDPDAIRAAQLQTSRELGRLGTKENREGVTRTALRAESAGLGPAGQTIQAATAIARSGEKDPGAVLESSIRKAFLAGFRDSREMQGLLEAASETAENTMDFGGAVDRMISLVGTGRPGEAKDIKQFMDSMDQQWGGATGKMEDMVKFNLLESKIGGLKGAGGAEPSDKVRKELRKFQNLKPSMMTDQYAEEHFSKETREFLDAANRERYGEDYKKKNKSVIKDISQSMILQGSTFGAALIGQKEEGADIVEGRKVLESGSKEDIKKKFPTREKFEDFLRLIRTNTEQYTGGDTKQGLVAAQNIANLYQEKTGEKVNVPGTQGIPKAPSEDPFGASAKPATTSEMKDVDKALAEGAKQSVGKRIVESKGSNDKNMLEEAIQKTKADREAIHQKALEDSVDVKTIDKKEIDKDKILPIEDQLAAMRDGINKMTDALKDFSVGEFVVNAAKDVVINGAKAVTGAVVDAGVSAVSKVIGTDIVNAIQKGLGKDEKPVTQGQSKPAENPVNRAPGAVRSGGY